MDTTPNPLVTGLFNKFRPRDSAELLGYRKEVSGVEKGNVTTKYYEGSSLVARGDLILVKNVVDMPKELILLIRELESKGTYTYCSGIEVNNPYRGKGLGPQVWLDSLGELGSKRKTFNDLVIDEAKGWAIHNLSTVRQKMIEKGWEVLELWNGSVYDSQAVLISYSRS